MSKSNPAYELFPPGNLHAPPLSPPPPLSTTVVPVPNCNEQRNGVAAIVNRDTAPNPAFASESEAVERNARVNAEALRRAAARNGK